MFQTTEEKIFIALAGIAVGCYILYRVIKVAVYHGTWEMRELLKSQIRIQEKELKKQGYNEAEIATILIKE